MASTSFRKPLAMADSSNSNCIPYPPPLAKFEEIVESPKLFMASLEKLHSIMGTKFMIPIIGGKELDLHRLFVEVTSRGGIEKVVREKRWKEVTGVFNFPSTATNASFVLRKYYLSLLHHYEQIYFFKAVAWNPSLPDSSRSLSASPATAQGRSSVWDNQPTQQPILNTQQLPAGVSSFASSTGSPVMGVIDGKFESGYLVTVTVGSEILKGVLYQAPPELAAHQVPLPCASFAKDFAVSTTPTSNRRRRRKKSEIKRRDPAHPKPNRSGYNFFFAEQHAILKPLYPGKDREISRMIGDLWNKLEEPERTVYQEKAMKDKERYRLEMEDYRERIRTGQVISDAVPLQQCHPEPDLNMAYADKNEETECGGDSPDHDMSFAEGDSIECKSEEKESEEEEASAMGGGGGGVSNVDVNALAVEDCEMRNVEEKIAEEVCSGNSLVGEKEEQAAAIRED